MRIISQQIYLVYFLQKRRKWTFIYVYLNSLMIQCENWLVCLVQFRSYRLRSFLFFMSHLGSRKSPFFYLIFFFQVAQTLLYTPKWESVPVIKTKFLGCLMTVKRLPKYLRFLFRRHKKKRIPFLYFITCFKVTTTKSGRN